ncbi:class I SAM-dependent methyltransferase [Thermomonospora umbrina]|uniref:class I SAM-dependent methyltransferase n=1 Tax=Thermomonospora umbrina TaxID=111806 RepID=UPI001477280D|nr:class I SAM-dependent methyltransferase [Thermomonospora umbrina]
MGKVEEAAASWDAEYARGRYAGEPPVPFTEDIVQAAKRAGLHDGIYLGCGSGRNLVPMIEAGLDLIGLDISATAIEQLVARVPDRRDRLVVGDLSALPADRRYDLVIALQVLQHGTRADTHALLEDASERVAPGGLFCVRLNAVGTDLGHAADVVERHEDGSFSVLYREGPKAGLTVHFWAAAELHHEALAAGLEPVLRPRPHSTWRPDGRSQWMQFEAIYRRPS